MARGHGPLRGFSQGFDGELLDDFESELLTSPVRFHNGYRAIEKPEVWLPIYHPDRCRDERADKYGNGNGGH